MNPSQHEAWAGLLMVLSEAQSLFQQFLNLLFHEERHLLILNRHGLTDVNNQKEQVLDAMAQIEQQVAGSLQQLAASDGQESMGVYLKKSRDPRAKTASAMLTDLFRLACRIQEQGKKNESLIYRIQRTVRGAIYFIHTGLGAGPIYQGSGTLNFPSAPSLVHLQG